MIRMKLEVILKEFPFLDAHFKRDALERGGIKIERVDSDLLVTTPRDTESVYFFNSQGELVGQIGLDQKRGDKKSWLPWKRMNRYVHINQSVEDAIDKFDPKGDKIFYVVKVDHSVYSLEMTIYKPPKSFTLKSWINERQLRYEKEIQTKITNIDAEGISS